MFSSILSPIWSWMLKLEVQNKNLWKKNTHEKVWSFKFVKLKCSKPKKIEAHDLSGLSFLGDNFEIRSINDNAINIKKYFAVWGTWLQWYSNFGSRITLKFAHTL